MTKTMTKDQQELVINNMDMAAGLARKFGATLLNDNHEKCIRMEDLEQDALEGLCIAATRFDETMGVTFETYAYYWCEKLVRRSLRKFSSPLSVPANYPGGEPPLHLDDMMQDVVTGYGDDAEDKGSPADRICYRVAMAEEADEADREALHERLQQALQGLNEQEQKVVTLLYGLGEDEPMSCEEAAEQLDLTPRRVRQIHERALTRSAIDDRNPLIFNV